MESWYEKLKALAWALRAAKGKSSSYELPAISIDGRDTVVKVSTPRATNIVVEWGSLTIEGYHNDLTVEDLKDKFGFSQQSISTFVDWVAKHVAVIAKEQDVVSEMEEIIAEWHRTNEDCYFRDIQKYLDDLELTDEQLLALTRYAELFVKYQLQKHTFEKIDIDDVRLEFVQLISIHKIPDKLAVYLIGVDENYKNMDFSK